MSEQKCHIKSAFSVFNPLTRSALCYEPTFGISIQTVKNFNGFHLCSFLQAQFPFKQLWKESIFKI